MAARTDLVVLMATTCTMIYGATICIRDTGCKCLPLALSLSLAKVVLPLLWTMFCMFLADVDLMDKTWATYVHSSSEVRYIYCVSIINADSILGQRWYRFQNMGPGPSPRHELTFTAVGERIVSVGGEASSGRLDEHAVYILDTGKHC